MRSLLWFSLITACLTSVTFAGDLTLSAHSDRYTTAWDSVLTVTAPGLMANDTAPEGDTIQVFLQDAPPVGELALNPDGSFTYQPVSGSQGPVSFVYRLENQNGEAGFATAVIDVTAGNKAPLAIADYYTVQVPNTLSVTAANGLLANDLDLDGHALHAELVTEPEVGLVELNPDGGFTFQCEPTDSGRYSFTYRVVDALGAGSEGEVHLTLVSPGLPVANPDQGDAFIGREAYINVVANDTDPDGNTLRVINVSGGDSQFIRVVDDQHIAYFTWSGSARTVMLNYTVTDGVHEVTSTVAVNVIQSYIEPVVENEHFVLAPGESVTFQPLDNDYDINGFPLIMSWGAPPEIGTLVTVSGEPDFRYTYIADAERGAYTEVFTYGVWNGFRAAYGQVTVEVTAPNEPPVVVNESIEVPLERVVPFLDVLANDHDPNGDALSISRISVQGEGNLTVFPVADNTGLSLQPWRSGTYVVTYWVTDGTDETPGQVEIVVPGPTENIARDDYFTLEVGRHMTLNVFANDVYIERNRYAPPEFNARGLRGSLAWSNGEWSFLAYDTYIGETSFTYTLPGDQTATVTINIVEAGSE